MLYLVILRYQVFDVKVPEETYVQRDLDPFVVTGTRRPRDLLIPVRTFTLDKETPVIVLVKDPMVKAG
jgi:hypothetical protein